MNIVVDSSLLAEALEDASKAISTKVIIPILSCFLIEATEDRVTVTGTDDRATIQSFVEENIDIKETGSAALPKVLLDILQKINGKIELQVKNGNQVTIKSRNKEIEITGMPPEEYPAPPEINENEFVEIKGKDLKNLIKKTVFAADIDGKSHPIITGVNVILQTGKIQMVATNRHRLARAEREFDIGNIGTAVIEARGIIELQKIVNDNDEVEFGFSKSSGGEVIYAFARTERFIFYSRVLEGIYPDTTHAMAIKAVTEITVNRKELIESLELIFTLAKEEKNNAVTFSVSEKEINIRGKGKETGKATESITPISFNGENFNLTLNAKYVLDALKVLENDVITLGYTGSLKPLTLRSDESSFYIVLPYRVAG
ncbi:DNA polymerase III subunit beta [Paenibacillus polymyxa]|uniref:DNA polymerase III subunit beta n=1 Tax=Paenibacillus polymyxa TaxID=1406 RepID=UPI000F86BDBF|nr:DNA polymerase III subunit beta [Paenibacillus polymyxa]RTZ38199.1 DNA polymerase III subunit beta [Paenibacillus polymyxa]